MRFRFVALAFAVLTGLSSCGSSVDPEYIAKLRSALDRAVLSLGDSVQVAETETGTGLGVNAKLLVDADPVFSVGAVASSAFKDVRIDIMTGRVLSVQDRRDAAGTCQGEIPLADAIAIAEAEVSGNAVQVQPDDDDRCHREIKVLSGDTLWEVKLARDGRVLEVEEDDGDDD